MEKNRLKKALTIIGKIYFCLATLFIVLIFAFSYSWYITDYGIDDFCTYVGSDQHYDILLDGNDRCKLDWFNFLEEALILPLFFYVVLLSPFFLIWLFKKIRGFIKNDTA